jgi:5-methyltetrahydrofolate--homocysteine methyltransferase
MGTLSDRVRSGICLVSDGAWGTFLQAKGLKAGECPELWNVTRPDDVYDIARSYIEAGANMIETNSFGGSAIKLASYNLESRAYELNRAAASISRRAAGDNHFVLGSIGPTGKILMMGEVSSESMRAAFGEQARALSEGGADAIIVETMSDIEEAVLAVEAAKEVADTEVICTMTFQLTADGTYRTMMGVSPADMVEQVVAAGAEVIGANCGNGIRDMVGVVREIRKHHADIPILIHANAGMPLYKDGQTVFPESPEEMCALVPELRDAGAGIIGGCCGTTPEHIRKIAEKLGS